MSTDPENALETGLTALGELLPFQQPLVDTLTEIAVFATAAIPGADGAGLTLLENNRQDTMVASTGFVRAMDEVQYRMGEGPCLLAVGSGAAQVSGSLGDEPRWPRFGPQAGLLGVHSALSLPLLLKGRVVGALNVYGHAHDAFGPQAVQIGKLFSRPAAASATNALLLEESRRLAQQLDNALASHTVIDRAVGVWMSRTGSSAEEAFTHLRALSRTEGRTLADVAQQTVDHATQRARGQQAPTGPG